MSFIKTELEKAVIYDINNNSEDIRVVFYKLDGNSINKTKIPFGILLGKLDEDVEDKFPTYKVNYKEDLQNNNLNDIESLLIELVTDFKDNYDFDIIVDYGDNESKAILFNNILSNVYGIEPKKEFDFNYIIKVN